MARYTICALFTMFQPHRPVPKIAILASFLPPKVEQNMVPDRGRQKYTQKRRRWRPNGGTGGHMVAQGYPMGPQTTPKCLQNSSKNEVPGPGAPPKAPKAPPGSKKTSKSMENRCKTGSGPRGKIRGSGVLQRTGSQARPRNPAENFAGSCTKPPSAADWAKPNWI